MVEKPRVPAEDPGLLDRFRNGDPAAFDEIVGVHRRSVYRVARRLLGSHEEADEAAQQALLRAWKARERFRGDASIKTWLTRIVLNVARSMRSSRPPADGLEDEDRLEEPGENAEQQIRRRQARAKVRRAVAKLPRRQQEVVVLKVFSDRTHKEVAEIMGLSEGAVKAHLHQAVSNLRREMVPADEPEGG